MGLGRAKSAIAKLEKTKILTGEDIIADKIGGLIAGWAIKNEDGSAMKVPAHPPLAKDTVNYVGDHVAVVIAETLDQAKNAADLVKVNYKVLKAVVSTSEAMNSNPIYKDIEKNLCFDFLLGDRAKTNEAFQNADKVIKIDLNNNRLIPNAMEPRAANADYNPSTEEITLYTTSQNPHLARIIISAFNGVLSRIEKENPETFGFLSFKFTETPEGASIF